jgi:hypothetical protein
MLMAGPLGALSVGLVASTTEFEDDVNGGSPGGHCRQVRQHAPVTLKTTSLAGPLGGAASGSGSVHDRG